MFCHGYRHLEKNKIRRAIGSSQAFGAWRMGSIPIVIFPVAILTNQHRLEKTLDS